MKKLNNKKGFTLAELLIVVAIIAVLVAIAIPLFTKQLEKSRDAVTVANLRAAYAEAAVKVLDSVDTTSQTIKGVAFKGIQAGFEDGIDKELPFEMSDKLKSACDGSTGAAGTVNVAFDFAESGTTADVG